MLQPTKEAVMSSSNAHFNGCRISAIINFNTPNNVSTGCKHEAAGLARSIGCIGDHLGRQGRKERKK